MNSPILPFNKKAVKKKKKGTIFWLRCQITVSCLGSWTEKFILVINAVLDSFAQSNENMDSVYYYLSDKLH